MLHAIVGTAGHIDHGKTALVRALTGIDTDRLKEEKARGITIDIGFASLALDDETTIGFVDVPGHERFIKNMLAGVGGIDIVLLVVAADESVMPQTREHLDICSLLHIQSGITVLTKIDAADPELVDIAEADVRELAKGTFLDGAPVVRVSAATGEGLPQLVDVIGSCARRMSAKDASRLFRLPVDRCFTMKGFGTVVSGTLVAGRIPVDAEVEILPPRQTARVRGIHVHGRPVAEATAGQRTALNLQRVEVTDVERGMVVVPPGVFTATSLIDAHVELLRSAPGPLLRRKRVRLHIGTAEVMGYVTLLGTDSLEPGGAAYAQLALDRPVFALAGDRFIIRQYSPMITIGGGEVLDAHPARHRRSDAVVPGRLAALREGSLDDRITILAAAAGPAAIAAGDVVARLGVAPADAETHLRALAAAGRLAIVGEDPLLAVDAPLMAEIANALAAEVARFHDANPLLEGIGREELRGRVLRGAPPALFRAALDSLIRQRRVNAQHEIVHTAGRTIVLDDEEARIRERLSECFRTMGLQAAAPEEVIATLNVNRHIAKRILQLMIKDDLLVRITDSLTVDRQALQKLIADVRALGAGRSRFGVKEFKELTGLSRKFAVPLLEYLDSHQVTRRIGDERVVL